jgi:hypothetical protein
MDTNQIPQLGPGDYGTHPEYAQRAFFLAMREVAPEIFVAFREQVWNVVLSSHQALVRTCPERDDDLESCVDYLLQALVESDVHVTFIEPELTRVLSEGIRRVYTATRRWASEYSLCPVGWILHAAVRTMRCWAASPDPISQFDWVVEPYAYTISIPPAEKKFEFAHDGWDPQCQSWRDFEPFLMETLKLELSSYRRRMTNLMTEKYHLQPAINGGAIIDHEAPLKRRFVAVQK